jgi:hypothetical protein
MQLSTTLPAIATMLLSTLATGQEIRDATLTDSDGSIGARTTGA